MSKIKDVRIVLILLFTFLLIVGVVYGSGTDNIDRRTVAYLDLDRYMGDWYEVARFDHSFERRMVEVKASYRLLPEGRIEVVNSGVDMRSEQRKRALGKAYVSATPGRLRVSFFWFFYSDYNILELDDDYRWVLVGSSSPKYLWVLSRTPRLDPTTLNHILALAHRRGYNTDQLLYPDPYCGEE